MGADDGPAYMDRQRLFMLAVALVALLGVTGMVSAFSALIPVLVLATLAFAATACIKFGTGNIFRLENVNTNF
ncbi:MAG: hypothetical protein ACLUIX_02075 [Oscillospiraceae bacterium]